MIPTRTFDYLDILKTRFRKDDIFAKISDGKWIKVSVDEYIEASWNVASGLIAKGYKPEDKIIVICNNRPEWNYLDMGCTLARLIFVPVYSTLSEGEFLHVFNHSDAKLIILGGRSLYNKLTPIIARMDHTAEFMTIDNCDCGFCMDDLISLGKQNRGKYDPEIERNKKEVSPDDVATIIYTSGTTGESKGVMLTHRNLTFDSYGHAIRQTAGPRHKMLSFLPLCHAYERTMNYEFQQLGISTYYAESLSTIARDLASFHGDGFCAVPRVLEMMYSKLEEAGKNLKGIKKIIYRWAWHFANKFDNKKTGYFYRLKHRLADRLVYSKWRDNLGGHEMWVVTGGAAIRPNIIRLFTAAKLRLYQGYGMTETSPVISVNPPANNVLGTNGTPLDNTELRIADDGEILVRGQHVMKGYYKDEKATREIIDEEGWLHTGDIGYLKDGKYLMITDRKKEIFKLSSGKYIAPQMIENKLRESSFIDNCIVFGEHQKFASAIIIPNMKEIREWCAKNNMNSGENDEKLIGSKEVVTILNKEVTKINKTLSEYEMIKKSFYTSDIWSVENGMLSQTLKPKRAVILSKYKAFVEAAYK
ncbi:MAG TPA: long-chain fatty acid--CoA ligase [Bacteroidales bacterium]|jgi:long-chain acyl-CoA synthetase|nr:long-chain fatty acid--CoA ligase [Bacteroidales bacterium]HOX74346.1 long-chain fatty acid--CoA ligase [Bacteroidales bacterium]HPM88580.1 long-chain fatty acid--CoA ligase [Bacteroidales bacterium]HQM68023.1 long-chain fatty acid--CoA ligase [Bacteroidales bacterium]